MQDSISKLEAVRVALVELGEPSAQELSDFIGKRFGLKIPPPFIPVVRASLLELELLDKARRAAKEVAASRAGDADEDGASLDAGQRAGGAGAEAGASGSG